MSDTHFDIISAFVDGEAVDPDALAATLAHADARALLADFLKLRAAMEDGEGALPSSLMRLRARRVAMWSAPVPLPVAVMLALLVGAASFAVSERLVDASGPPAATRTIRFESGVDWQPVNAPVGRP